jgi:hypothetical protein
VSESFLQLPPDERSKIYRSLAPKLGRTPEVLEKDVWVCWAGYARYDDCLHGNLRLIPNEASLVVLQDDFKRMVGAGMFIGAPPPFESIIARLRELETTINS